MPIRRGDQKLINSLFNLSDTDRRLRKLYNTFVLLAYLMNTICGENHWAMRLKELIDSHHVDPAKMGFPTDWQQKNILELRHYCMALQVAFLTVLKELLKNRFVPALTSNF